MVSAELSRLTAMRSRWSYYLVASRCAYMIAPTYAKVVCDEHCPFFRQPVQLFPVGRRYFKRLTKSRFGVHTDNTVTDYSSPHIRSHWSGYCRRFPHSKTTLFLDAVHGVGNLECIERVDEVSAQISRSSKVAIPKIEAWLERRRRSCASMPSLVVY